MILTFQVFCWLVLIPSCTSICDDEPAAINNFMISMRTSCLRVHSVEYKKITAVINLYFNFIVYFSSLFLITIITPVRTRIPLYFVAAQRNHVCVFEQGQFFVCLFFFLNLRGDFKFVGEKKNRESQFLFKYKKSL